MEKQLQCTKCFYKWTRPSDYPPEKCPKCQHEYVNWKNFDETDKKYDLSQPSCNPKRLIDYDKWQKKYIKT